MLPIFPFTAIFSTGFGDPVTAVNISLNSIYIVILLFVMYKSKASFFAKQTVLLMTHLITTVLVYLFILRYGG